MIFFRVNYFNICRAIEKDALSQRNGMTLSMSVMHTGKWLGKKVFAKHSNYLIKRHASDLFMRTRNSANFEFSSPQARAYRSKRSEASTVVLTPILPLTQLIQQKYRHNKEKQHQYAGNGATRQQKGDGPNHVFNASRKRLWAFKYMHGICMPQFQFHALLPSAVRICAVEHVPGLAFKIACENRTVLGQAQKKINALNSLGMTGFRQCHQRQRI